VSGRESIEKRVLLALHNGQWVKLLTWINLP